MEPNSSHGLIGRYRSVDNEHFIYNDGPLEGYAVSDTGEHFAFSCLEILSGMLWHWTLIPVTSTSKPVSDIVEAARSSPPEFWVSILEDNRDETPHVSECRMVG
ncbi:MAG TPA: hypothetical protein VLX92_31030, partial [Kofleriaceae bacterium]|nr:hypothetical protein [Kofleriaceae bacterium]